MLPEIIRGKKGKKTSCSCAEMETPNINRTSREALLQQCLADIDMNIRELDAESKVRDLLVTTWARTHEIGEMQSGAGIDIKRSAEEEKEMLDKSIGKFAFGSFWHIHTQQIHRKMA